MQQRLAGDCCKRDTPRRDATWHLYRRVVEPDGTGPKFHEPKLREQRYAADFPAALFPSRRKDPA